jgi:hypothetical protein
MKNYKWTNLMQIVENRKPTKAMKIQQVTCLKMSQTKTINLWKFQTTLNKNKSKLLIYEVPLISIFLFS